MRVGVLGALEVTGDDRVPRPVASSSQRTVLALLAARCGEVVTTDALVDALWGDDPPPSALKSLRSHVSRLRKDLGDAVATRPGGYLLEPARVSLDSVDFERLCEEASGAAPGQRVELLATALRLWRGPAFAGVDLDVLEGEARRLGERRSAATEALAAAHLAEGSPELAVSLAEALVTDQPLREGAWVLLVSALAASRRQGEALRAYRRAADALAEAGLEPSAALRTAEREALVSDRPVSTRDAPAARQAAAGPGGNRLLRPPDRLVGRDDDVRGVAALLERIPVVTLVGPGGVGKTRLALEVAAVPAVAERGDVVVVDLAGVPSGGDVASPVLDALGMAVESGGVRSALTTAGALEVLLVLDNCEHVLDGAAAVVEALTGGTAALRVLATSRERLRVPGEHTWSVEPLGVDGPGGHDSARELFAERAEACSGIVADTPAEQALVERIVARLDGLPLAIEMAASSLSGMGLAELDEVLEERLDHVDSGTRTVDDRHRTLDALVAWSTGLLDDRSMDALRTLSVFAGAMGRDAITGVADRDTAAVLAPSLAERSLLVVERSGERVRYRMLDTVRRRVAAGAGSRRMDALARHARYHAQLVGSIDRQMRGPEEAEAVDRLDGCFAELPGTVTWGLAHDPELTAELLGGLHLAARNQVRDQPLAWAAQALAATEEPAHGELLLCAAQRAVHTGELGAAEDLARRALEAGPRRVEVLELLSDVLMFRGRTADAIEVAESMVTTSRELGDTHGEVLGIVNLALSTHYGGDTPGAAAMLDGFDSATPSVRGWLEFSHGEIELADDPASAVAHLEEAIALADGVRNRMLGGVARVSIASLLARSGEPSDAATTFRSLVGYWRRHPSRTYLVTTLRHMVVLLTRLGLREQAAELLGAVSMADDRPSVGDEARQLAEARSRLEAGLGARRVEEAVRTGAARRPEQAAALALDAL